MKLASIIFFLLFWIPGFSQTRGYENKQWQAWKRLQKLQSMQPGNGTRDTSSGINGPVRPLYLAYQRSVLKVEDKGIYVGSIGNGLALYEMQVDKMPCITPDETFEPNMPGSGRYNQKRLRKPE